MNGDRRQYIITKLPQYLIVHIKRFSKNTQHFAEKNPTIVNFPVKGGWTSHAFAASALP